MAYNTNKYAIPVPNLGDQPDISVVSTAVDMTADAAACKMEAVSYTITGADMVLSSQVRAFETITYYAGYAAEFVATADISSITTVSLDSLPPQPGTITHAIKAGDIVKVTYNGTGFDLTPFASREALDAEASTRSSEDAAIRSEFAAADGTLQANIDAEASTRASEDTAVRAEFASADDAVTAAYIAADGVITTNYQSADSGLQTNIDAEATTRASEISRLEGLIALKADLTGAAFTGAITSTADITAFIGSANIRDIKVIQTEIIELEVLKEKAEAKSYTELASDYATMISELEIELEARENG